MRFTTHIHRERERERVPSDVSVVGAVWAFEMSNDNTRKNKRQ